MALMYDRGPAPGAPVQKMGGSSSLADVLNVILDKGIVIDAWARVSVVGIEILTIEARVVVASVETYLRYAEAIGLTALAAAPPTGQGNQQGGRAQQNGRHANGQEAPSEDEVLGYLSDHPEGLRLGELQAYFDAPRDQLGDVVNQLVEERKATRDDKSKLFYAADNGR